MAHGNWSVTSLFLYGRVRIGGSRFVRLVEVGIAERGTSADDAAINLGNPSRAAKATLPEVTVQ
jgi:hypothetical protein